NNAMAATLAFGGEPRKFAVPRKFTARYRVRPRCARHTQSVTGAGSRKPPWMVHRRTVTPNVHRALLHTTLPSWGGQRGATVMRSRSGPPLRGLFRASIVFLPAPRRSVPVTVATRSHPPLAENVTWSGCAGHVADAQLTGPGVAGRLRFIVRHRP